MRLLSSQRNSSVESDDELTGEARRNRLTRLTIHGASGCWLLMTLLYLFEPHATLGLLGPVMTFSFIQLASAQYFNWRGQDRIAALIVCIPILPTLVYSMWFLGGVVGGGGMFTIVGVIFSAATLGRRAALLMTAASVLSLLGIALAEAEGLLPASTMPSSPLLQAGQLISMLVVSAVLLDTLARSLLSAQAEAETASQQRAEVESRYVSVQKLEPVGQLASGVAHDFNNLLSVMTSVSAALRGGAEERDRELGAKQNNEEVESVAELLDDLDEATARASLMTGQLLSFSRRRVFEVDSIDLDEVLDSLTPMLSRLLGDDVNVLFHGSTEGLSVEADRGQLEQVILNLAVNARDAMPKGGTVSIRLGRDPERDLGVYLEVADDGIGMSEEVVSRIFDPFYTTKPEGTGLGLATVHDITTRICGTINVSSRVGEGTCFRLELPASESPATGNRPSISRQRILPKAARLLLAEDHELLRRATQRSLEQVGYSVTSVVNGQEALALLQGGATFDALVTDISMPKLGGVELAQQLKQQGLELPVLFISGNTGSLPQGLEEMRFAPRFLAKPFSQSDFLNAIDKCVAQSRQGPRISTKPGNFGAA